MMQIDCSSRVGEGKKVFVVHVINNKLIVFHVLAANRAEQM